ncbi:triose-phosphate isomerase, partial [Candidatus Gottesmanbacteria bacterium]|nr:triose-phosphate isomerase [Candidatus Gottesmanbacteria bacterium]
GTKFLYGGSVNLENAKSFSFTDGLVIGHASLDSETFFQICASF